jgi:hypothetical protein
MGAPLMVGLQSVYTLQVDSSEGEGEASLMFSINRRRFISGSSVMAASCVADLSFLTPLSHGAAANPYIDPDEVAFGPETERLLRLLRETPPAECVPAFVKELRAGLSYQQFLTVLFLGGIENGDPHQVAQVFGAHRISSEARIEERLLPLFWVMNRLKQGQEADKPALKHFKGALPRADLAESSFNEALVRRDPEALTAAALALARDFGGRHVMHRLWAIAGRNLGGTLGHPAIALANSIRALEVMGWQHSEVGVRYMAGFLGSEKEDRTYRSNLERAKKILPGLSQGWSSAEGQSAATLELYKVLREGNPSEACELICAQLSSGKVKAGAVWDAVSLAAADTLVRYKRGGISIGGSQIHAVTTTNALRYGFNLVDDGPTKLINLLQAAGVTADFFVRLPKKEGNLREMDLLDLGRANTERPGGFGEVFELLPFKSNGYNERNPAERASSDQACRMAFKLVSDRRREAEFMRTARSFLCVKASLNPHDIKYPAAAFEEAYAVSPEWRPYLLASSVHALHGTKSKDTPALLQVREALK